MSAPSTRATASALAHQAAAASKASRSPRPCSACSAAKWASPYCPPSSRADAHAAASRAAVVGTGGSATGGLTRGQRRDDAEVAAPPDHLHDEAGLREQAHLLGERHVMVFLRPRTEVAVG